jgi:hypothetical protein
MKTIFRIALLAIGIGFAIFFFITIGPLLIQNPDISEAFKAGFVNPYSSGFSTDVIACWLVLAGWVVYERAQKGIGYGWIALLLWLIPGVATGFAFYLFLRSVQLKD